jgi:hypothetical protein
VGSGAEACGCGQRSWGIKVDRMDRIGIGIYVDYLIVSGLGYIVFWAEDKVDYNLLIYILEIPTVP